MLAGLPPLFLRLPTLPGTITRFSGLIDLIHLLSSSLTSCSKLSVIGSCKGPIFWQTNHGSITTPFRTSLYVGLPRTNAMLLFFFKKGSTILFDFLQKQNATILILIFVLPRMNRVQDTFQTLRFLGSYRRSLALQKLPPR